MGCGSSSDDMLYAACKEGDLEGAKQLLEDGADPTGAHSHEDEWKKTPIHVAKTPDIMMLLLTKGRDGAHLVVDGVGKTPLHRQAEARNEANCKLLIDAGADMDARDERGWTPMMCAAHFGYPELMLAFVKWGAQTTAVTPEDDDGNGGDTAFHIAATAGKLPACKCLLDKGGDLTSLNLQMRTPLLCAAAQPHDPKRHDTIHHLLSRGADINDVDKEDWSSLHHAAFHGNWWLVNMLVQKGADQTLRTNKGKSAISLAKRQMGEAPEGQKPLFEKVMSVLNNEELANDGEEAAGAAAAAGSAAVAADLDAAEAEEDDDGDDDAAADDKPADADEGETTPPADDANPLDGVGPSDGGGGGGDDDLDEEEL